MMPMPRASSKRGMVEPQALQNQCAKNLASGKRYLVSSSSPRKNRKPSSGTSRFVACPVPRVLRQRLQWHWVTPLGVAVISNSIPPHKQLPFTLVIRPSVRDPGLTHSPDSGRHHGGRDRNDPDVWTLVSEI